MVKGLKEFQFRQDRPGECMVKFILNDDGTSADAERFGNYLQSKFDGRMSVQMVEVASLLAGTNGKRSYIDQRLDTSSYRPCTDDAVV